MYKYLISGVVTYFDGRVRSFRTIIEIENPLKTEQDIYNTEKLLELDEDMEYCSICSFNLLEE